MLLLKNLLFTVVVPGTVAGLMPSWIAAGAPRATGWIRLLALVAFTLGSAIYLWCLWDFAAFGRGTPAPIDAPKRLVTRGLYGYSRNPMYVGVLTVIAGWALYFASIRVAGYALAVFAAFSAFVRFYEEPRLRREFGDEYAAYSGRVGRWLPRMVK